MIKTLIGIRLRALLGSAFSKKKGKSTLANKALMLSLLIFLAVTFLAFFTVMAFGMAMTMIPLGLDALYFSIFMIAAFSIVFILSIFETKSELFECKDNEFLLSLPIKPRHIVLARIFTVLIYNLAETAIVMIPAVVMYLVFGGSSLGAVGGLLLTLFLPLLATSLASGVGYLVALLMKRIKRSNLFTVLISLLFFAAYFVGYSYFVEGMSTLDDPTADFGAIADSFGIAGKIGNAALLDPVWAVSVIVISILFSLAAYLIISANYISIVTDVRSAKKRKYKREELKGTKPFLALTKKELKKFFSSPTYILNAGMGVIFAVALGIFALFKKDLFTSLEESVASVFGSGIDTGALLSALLVFALSAVFAFATISSSSLSLEGHSLWIIKSMPLSAKDVLFGKSLAHIIVCAPAVILTSVLLITASGASFVYWVFFLLCPMAVAALAAFLGTLVNVSFPKFEFENEAQPIKQSASASITLFSLMFYVIIVGGGALVLSLVLSPVVALLIFFAVTASLASLFAWLISTVGVRKYDEICV